MKLPGRHLAVVPERKITEYLLNSAHPIGRGKALFFQRFGFRTEEWFRLAEALRKHAHDNPVVETEVTPYGVRYAVDGRLFAPDGTTLHVRSAWFIDNEEAAPRFVTAHPLPKT